MRNQVSIIKIYYQKDTKTINDTIWLKEIKISNDQWNNLYTVEIINESDNQIAEFNFKLLHNQLNCNYNVKRNRIKMFENAV